MKVCPKIEILSKNWKLVQKFIFRSILQFSITIHMFGKKIHFCQILYFRPKSLKFGNNFSNFFSKNFDIYNNVYFFWPIFYTKNSILIRNFSIKNRKNLQMKERIEHGLQDKTRSIWPHLLENKPLYENPLYNKETRNHVIIPTPSVLKLVFWSRLYAKTPFFTRHGTFVQHFTPKLFFSKDELHIILKLRNLEIGEHSSFLNYWTQIWLRSLTNSDNLIIFKFRNSKVDLKANFVNNWKTRMLSNFQISKTLKWYEARRSKKQLRGVNFVQKSRPS